MKHISRIVLLSAFPLLAGCPPRTDFNASVRVIDGETGKPIPDALVLVGAYVSVEPPLEPPYNVGLAAARGMTDINGAIEFNRVEGMYEGQKPTDPLWKMLESRKPEITRKITGIKSGSVVVFAPRYGAFHQPFGIKDNPDFQKLIAELGISPEAYTGWLGPGPADWNYTAVSLDAKQLQKGLELTVKVGKVSNPEHPLASFQPDVMWLTAVASSRQTGSDVGEKKQIYEFFKGQMEYAARVSSDPFYREQLVKLADPDNEKAFIDPNRGLTAEENHDTAIHEWLTQKALELLPKDYVEPKQYAAAILEGVKDEDGKARFYNHFYNPYDPQTGYDGNATALKWGAIGYPDNPDNEWDWEDAQRYYREGDKEKAYKALGHVLHLLEDLSCPLHTRSIRHINHLDDAARFEAYFSKLAKDNANTLPMEYSLNAEQPKAGGLKEQFDAMAKLTFGTFERDRQKVSFDNYYTWSPNKSGSQIRNPEPEAIQLMGKYLFPKTIGSGTALVKRFYDAGHPELSAQAAQQKKELTDAGNVNGQFVNDVPSSTTNIKGQDLRPDHVLNIKGKTKDVSAMTPLERIRFIASVKGSRKVNIKPLKPTEGIETGCVIAYGHYIKSPYKVENEGNKILVNGVQVAPSLVIERERAKEPKIVITPNKEQRYKKWEKLRTDAYLLYQSKKGKVSEDVLHKEVLNFVITSTDIVEDAHWDSLPKTEKIYIRWVDWPAFEGVDFQYLPPSLVKTNPDAKKKVLQRITEIGERDKTRILNELHDGVCFIFQSDSGRTSLWHSDGHRSCVNTAMKESVATEDERIEKIAKCFGGNYHVALDIIENYDAEEWKLE